MVAAVFAEVPFLLQNTIIAGNFTGASPSTVASDLGGTVDAGSHSNLIGTGGSSTLVDGTNNNQVGVSNPGLVRPGQQWQPDPNRGLAGRQHGH